MTRAHEALWECPLPILAAVQGACLAGGADLVLHCDFIFMSEDAHIGYPPVCFLGVPPTNMWLYRLGLQHARKALLTGAPITSAEAQRCGIADVVADDQLDSATFDFANSLSQTSRELLMSNKWVINRGVDLMGRHMLSRIAHSEDALAHTSPASVRFKENAATSGVKGALRQT
jgi:enoyl-CoA hydratase